jgi:hypothetical protein
MRLSLLSFLLIISLSSKALQDGDSLKASERITLLGRLIITYRDSTSGNIVSITKMSRKYGKETTRERYHISTVEYWPSGKRKRKTKKTNRIIIYDEDGKWIEKIKKKPRYKTKF